MSGNEVAGRATKERGMGQWPRHLGFLVPSHLRMVLQFLDPLMSYLILSSQGWVDEWSMDSLV